MASGRASIVRKFLVAERSWADWTCASAARTYCSKALRASGVWAGDEGGANNKDRPIVSKAVAAATLGIFVVLMGAIWRKGSGSSMHCG